jgi:hypothetical protein
MAIVSSGLLVLPSMETKIITKSYEMQQYMSFNKV